jgi:hypothetical protein
MLLGVDNSASKDCSHVWRVPGTVNRPTKSKLARGRSPEPQPVKAIKPFDGSLIDPEFLLHKLEPAKPNGKDRTGHEGPDDSAAPHTKSVDWPVVESALEVIPADDRDTWLKVGAALHWTGAACARDVWDKWSKASTKFDERDQDKTWQGFKADRPDAIKIATIFKLAKDAGWVKPEAGHVWPEPKAIPEGLPPVAILHSCQETLRRG